MKKNEKWLYIGVLIILVLGIWGYFISGKIAHKNLEHNQIFTSNLVCSTINSSNVIELLASQEDKENLYYQHLKKSFTRIQDFDSSIRYIYIIGKRNNEFFFYIDSQSELYSNPKLKNEPLAEPGEIYKDFPEILYEIFEKGEVQTYGPYTDKWGTFVSTFNPFVNDKTGKVDFVLGIDMKYSKWNAYVSRQQLGIILLTLLLIIIHFITFKLFDNQRKNKIKLEVAHNQLEIKVKKRTVELEESNKRLKEEIFAREEIEKALIESEQHYKDFADLLPQIVCETDDKGVFTFINKTAYEIMGYTKDEVPEDFSIFDTIIPEQHSIAIKNIENVVVGKYQNGVEYTLQKKDKTRIQTYIYSQPIYHNNIYKGMRSIVVDISDLKNAQEQLLENEQILKHKNTELEELNKELIVAKEKAELSDKLKTAFLSNISHEIRTPLNGILGFSELLADFSVSLEDKKEYAEIVTSCSKQLLSIINDVVDISMMETGLIKVKKTSVDILHLITDIKTIFSVQANKKAISLKVENQLLNNEVIVKVDENKIRQVLNNFIVNALKFTDSGSVQFGLVEKESSLLFYVKDSGIGISEEDKSIIFERFQQVNTNSMRGGNGLGLAISKGLVQLMNGEIWVESEIGAGSTFYFEIPKESSELKAANLKESLGNQLQYDWSEKKIIIAEDNFINFKLIETILNPTKVSILYAKNGIEAISILSENKNVDLILMDMKMPEMDGYEATLEIRKFNTDIPIIAQTAYAFVEERERAMSVGCNNIVTKPIDKNNLFSTLSKYLDAN